MSLSQLRETEDRAKVESRRAKRTFKEFADTWTKKRTQRHKQSVKRTNESLLRNHLLPRWGDVALVDITPEAVDDWALVELAPGRPGARRHAYELFRAIMRSAEALNIVEVSPCTSETDENVAASCKAEESRRHAARGLSDLEIEGLVRELPDSMLPMFKFMLMTGIRLGEARELRWKDINFSEGTFSPRQMVLEYCWSWRCLPARYRPAHQVFEYCGGHLISIPASPP